MKVKIKKGVNRMDLEIKEKNDLIEDEKFDFIETIIKEIMEKLNILDLIKRNKVIFSTREIIVHF